MAYIDGDGPNPDIYHLLWKNEGFLAEKAQINIPDTIIFMHGTPVVWYFTSIEGKVLKKKQNNLTFENITKKFVSKSSPEDIVGYFIHVDDSILQERLFRRQNRKETSNIEQNTPRSLIEYYTAKDFETEFTGVNTFSKRTGILQSFIQPYGDHNVYVEVIQAVWSPNLCVFTKRINSRKVNDTKLKAYERASTFDGPDFCSEACPMIGRYGPSKLREVCENFVNHIMNISYEKIMIQRLVAYFKTDEKGRIYFMWAGSVRVKETDKKRVNSCADRPLSLEPCVQNVEVLKNKGFKRATSHCTRESYCVECEVYSNNLVPITYKILIEYQKKTEKISSTPLQNRKQITPGDGHRKANIILKETGFGIPPFIKKMHPSLKLKEYLSLIQQNDFLLQKTSVCSDCFLNATTEYEKDLIADNNTLKDTSNIQRKRVTKGISRDKSLVKEGHYESYCEPRNSQKPLELTQIDEKFRSKSGSRISSPTNVSKSTLASNTTAANLKFKMSLLMLKRKESQNFSEKSDFCSLSINQNSSPARLKNQSINDQFSSLVDRLSQNSANITMIKDKINPSSRDSSIITRGSIICPKSKPASLNHLNNASSSRMYQSGNEAKDFDDFLNESNEELSIDRKLQNYHSETSSNFQSIRERYSKNESKLIDKETPSQRSFESRFIRSSHIQPKTGNGRFSLTSSNLRKETFGACELDQQSAFSSLFLKSGYPFLPSLEEPLNFNSKPQTNKDKSNSSIIIEKENFEKPPVNGNLYKKRVNTAHRTKVRRI